jgi:hypothetical protein
VSIELPLRRNWEGRGWKPKFSRGMRSGDSGFTAKRGAAASRRQAGRIQARVQRRRRCVVGMGELGTGMAQGAYPYTTDSA